MTETKRLTELVVMEFMSMIKDGTYLLDYFVGASKDAIFAMTNGGDRYGTHEYVPKEKNICLDDIEFFNSMRERYNYFLQRLKQGWQNALYLGGVVYNPSTGRTELLGTKKQKETYEKT